VTLSSKTVLWIIVLTGCAAASGQRAASDSAPQKDCEGYARAFVDLQKMRILLNSAAPGDGGRYEVETAASHIDAAIRDIKGTCPDIQFDSRDRLSSDQQSTSQGNQMAAACQIGKAVEGDVRKQTNWDFGGGLRRRVLVDLELAVRALEDVVRRTQ